MSQTHEFDLLLTTDNYCMTINGIIFRFDIVNIK